MITAVPMDKQQQQQQQQPQKWSKIDAWLSKALRRVFFLSLAVHSVLLVKNSSKSTASWLEGIATAQYMEDFPTLSSWGLDGSFDMSNDTSSLSEMNASANTIATTTTDMLLLSPGDVRAPRTTNRIPLDGLIQINGNETCNPGKSKKYLIESTVLPENMTYPSTRKIPKIVHITSKTRCMTPAFIHNIDLWRFPGYALYFHDDAAVDRLLAKYWPEFPHLQLLQQCSVSGAAKADIWRLLVLWEYGGIYTDIDNAPGPKFRNGTVIKDDDDAWFVVERIGVLSQYFMATSPKHPIIFVALTTLMERLLEVENIQKQYVPYVTGPGTMKSAMILFMKDATNFEKVKKGKYIGLAGRSVTVEGTRGKSNQYVKRESVSGIHKKGGYAAMGMTHFSRKVDDAPTSSCHEHLFQQTKKLLDTQRLQSADWQQTAVRMR